MDEIIDPTPFPLSFRPSAKIQSLIWRERKDRTTVKSHPPTHTHTTPHAPIVPTRL